MNTMETIVKRQSCRNYTGEQLTEKELTTILQAANAAPISKGAYADIKIVVVQNKELIAKLEANAYAVMNAVGEHPTYGAPTVIIVCGKKEEGMTVGIPYCNASCVIENMMLAAAEISLGSVYLLAVPIMMSHNAELCAECKVPEGFFPVAMMGIGKTNGAMVSRELTVSKLATEFIR